MAYHDGEILTPVSSEQSSARDLGFLVPPKVMDELYLKDESDLWIGITSGEVRVEIQETSGYSKVSCRLIIDNEPMYRAKGANRWAGDQTAGEETYTYKGNSIRPGVTIVDHLGINDAEVNNVRWTVDTDNWRCVLTKVVK
tara:strand:- start:10299 stop:10721 length:423 start_codon:yes stop_codon:yes gene_type:complete